MAQVRLRNVDKTYTRGVRALTNLSLEIQDQEFLVLVGPSGCGKSTILRIVAGLEEVTSGEVWIGDRRVDGTAPRERDIAMVFQNYALYPHMTAFQNIAFGLRLRKTPKSEIGGRVHEAARILNIEDLLDKMPKALSGGERQRVALGRAIVRNPRVFLFDEPLSNLDAKLRSEMRAEISALHQRLRVTTIYVTHDQVEAMTMGERIVVLKKGEIQQIGTPLEVYSRPANRFVGGFIGNPSMNFMNVRMDETGSALEIGGGPKLALDARDGSAGMAPGREAVLGMRPEDVHLDPSGPVTASVTLVEPTGGESFVYAERDGAKLIARAPVRTDLAIGSEVRFRFDLSQAHFFDRETEERINP